MLLFYVDCADVVFCDRWSIYLDKFVYSYEHLNLYQYSLSTDIVFLERVTYFLLCFAKIILQNF